MSETVTRNPCSDLKGGLYESQINLDSRIGEDKWQA